MECYEGNNNSRNTKWEEKGTQRLSEIGLDVKENDHGRRIPDRAGSAAKTEEKNLVKTPGRLPRGKVCNDAEGKCL